MRAYHLFAAFLGLALFSHLALASSVIYDEDFDGLNGSSNYVDADTALGSEWSFYTSNEGRARIYDWGGSRGGVLVLDDSVGNNVYSLVEAILTVDLSGLSDATLNFDHYDSDDEEHQIGTAAFTGHKNADGVAISSNGVNWFPLIEFNQANGSWRNYDASITAAVAAINNPLLQLTSSFLIKFQQYDNYQHGYDGRKFDDVVLTGQVSQPPVPEPATATLFVLGLAGLAVSRRRQRGVSDD